jgi:tetratricopeptide (TPR) repeat protein
MSKNKKTLKDNFLEALESYKKREFKNAEMICHKILSINSNHFNSNLLLATISAGNKDFLKSKNFLNEALKIEPKNLSAITNLGTVYKELGKIDEAMKFYNKALEIEPNHTNANYNIGVTFFSLGKIPEAKKYLEKTVSIQSNFAMAFHSLAEVHVALKEFRKAVGFFQKAIEINPNLFATHNNLGLLYRDLDDVPNAIKCFEKAISISSKYGNSLHNLAEIYREKGEFEKAIKFHKLAIVAEPNNLMNDFFLSDMDQKTLTKDLKEKVNNILSRKKTSVNNLAYGNYLLAKYERKSNNYEKEFDYLIKGHSNFYIRNKKKFDLNLKYCFEDIHQIIKEGKIEKSLNKNKNKIVPIFVFGVPRSGSTLVERIIVSGKKKIALGEETGIVGRYFLNKVLQRKNLNLGSVDDIRIELFNIYMTKGLVSENYNFSFTDKSLDNYFYINFLKEIYPNAKFIHCKRDKLSSIVSIFQNNLTALAWCHDLENIFKYFDNYLKIVDDMKKTNPNMIYDLQFEDLIENPEKESKKLMEFCEVPWDKKCLEFYKRKELISKTASNIQIRKSIYKHSLEKYTPYKKILEKYGKKYSWFKL